MSQRHTAAFSLLELSLVLAIIAVVLVFGLNIAGSATKGSDRVTTQERLVAIQRAIDSYARINGHLPCPAPRNAVPGETEFGSEARNNATKVDCVTAGTGITRTGGTPFAYIGAVPVRTLGLPDSYSGDAWRNKLTYAVSGAHVGAIGSYFSADGMITVRSGDRTGTNYIVTTQRSSDGNNLPGPAATYVVVSHGPDGKGAYPMNASSVAIACGSSNNNDVENCDDGNAVFYDTAYNDGEQEAAFFDDYIVWGSNALDRLPTTRGGPGTGCGNGPCELWCAPCDASVPPATTPYAVCRRSIISTAPCRALCEYAYPNANVFCP